VCPKWHPELPALAPSLEVTFLMHRLVKVECDATIGGEQHRVWHYETEPSSITVTCQELEELLSIYTPQLYFALAYYLIGCENIRSHVQGVRLNYAIFASAEVIFLDWECRMDKSVLLKTAML
jgi:hypothetical protein